MKNPRLIRAAEEQARKVLDAIPEQIWSGPADGTLDYCNYQWRAYAGLRLEELQVDGWQRVLHPDDKDRVLKAWRESVANGTPYEQEERHRRADEVYRWFLCRGVPLRDAAGRVERWYVANTDIEDRKRAEEKLSESESRLAEAQRLAHVGSWNWDLRTHTVTWSDELYRLFGIPPQQLNLGGIAMELIHPEDRDLLMSVINTSLKTKEPYNHFYRVLRSDGVERIVNTHGVVVCDEHGDPIRVFGATQDVTERQRTEEALRAAERKYRDIFENAREGIFQTSPAGLFLTANPALAKMFGYDSPEELDAARTNIAYKHYVEPERRREFIRELERQGSVIGFEYEARRKDGSTLWVSDNVRAVFDEEGKVAYYEGTAVDITDRKLAHEALQSFSRRLIEAQESERQAVARELHDEIGQVLTAVKMSLEIHRHELPGEASSNRLDENIAIVEEALTKVRDLSLNLHPMLLDDLGLLSALSWYIRRYSKQTGIETSYSITGCGEEDRFPPLLEITSFRVVQEALTNIARHARANHASVALRCTDDCLMLSIKDNGEGFDITRRKDSRNPTLGLRGMEERAQAIGGVIQIISQPSKGTEITVRFPFADHANMFFADEVSSTAD